jgi:hypothetical protein
MSESAAELRRLIELVSATIEPTFRKEHSLWPSLWHCIDRDGDMHVVAAPDESKNTAAVLMRAFMEVHDIVRYCYAAEAWTVTGRDVGRYIARGGKAEDHPNRQEVVFFSAEDESGMLTASRLILRRIGKNPRLGPLVINDMQGWTSEGRLVGMLPRRGTVQKLQVLW